MSTEAQAAARAVRGLSPLDPPYATSTGSGTFKLQRKPNEDRGFPGYVFTRIMLEVGAL